MFLSPVSHRILFARQEIDVDDIEAPLPDPFDNVRDCESPAHFVKHKKQTMESMPIPSSPADPKVLSGGLEPDVDNAEAPLPDPFNYIEEPANRRVPLSLARQKRKRESDLTGCEQNVSKLPRLFDALLWDGIMPKLLQVYIYMKYLLNLADKFGSRYNRTRSIDDLQKAIVCGQLALAVAPGYHLRGILLRNLAARLGSRYDRTGAMDDLQQAIVYSQEALAATPQDHLKKAGYLNNLALQLGTRYGRTGAMDDLQQSIMYGQEALAEIPQDHPNKASYLNNLALQLGSRYDRTGAMGDLEQATLYHQEALEGTPEDHLKRASYLTSLARSLFTRFRLRSNAEDIKNCITHLRTSWHCSTSPPSVRIETALVFFNVFCIPQEPQNPLFPESFLRRSEESSSLLEGAVLLLPKVSPRLLERKDQQYNLSSLIGLAEAAGTSALVSGRTAYDALKLLELSRGIIMGFAIDCRGDLPDLKEANLGLFNKFNDLRIEIDAPLPGFDRSNDLFDMPSQNFPLLEKEVAHNRRTQAKQRREEAARQMEETITEIRNLPGHKGFQLPPSPKELMSMATEGPIVIFMSTAIQSNAIIVTNSTIKSIPLPKLHRDHRKIPNRLGEIAKLAAGRLKTAALRNKKIRELLFWLWDIAVEPVIQDLQLTPRSANLPYIWWIGVGPLSTAPFHAAGDYSQNSDPHQNVLSYAISSYTPTIKALSYARERAFTVTDSGKQDTKLLLVTMPKTPGNADLPDVEEEVAKITRATNGSVSTEHIKQPSAKDILDKLQSCHVAHFACHGISDKKDPSESHLVLVKDGKTDKLSVQDISTQNRNTGVAQLAYLSACSTADNSSRRLADETIHIASGFQLAGFNHVLATMWASDSKVCKEVSTDFYRSLFDGSGSGEGHQKVRIAFHEAVKKAQRKYWSMPLKWAPFIHMGA